MAALRTTAAVVVLVAPAMLAAGFHGETCSGAGAQPAAPVGDAFAFHGVLEPSNGLPYHGGTPHKWSLTLGPGDHHLVAAQVGDADIAVCRVGQLLNRHACTAGNALLWPAEACFVGPQGNPDFCCSFPGPGDFVIYVFYCSGLACGYPVDAPAVAYAGVVV